MTLIDNDTGVLITEERGIVPATTLVLTPPNRHSKGFLRRQMQALDLQERLEDKDNIDASLIRELVDFLSLYVTVPSDRAAAREALLDASQEEYEQALEAIREGNGPPPLEHASA